MYKDFNTAEIYFVRLGLPSLYEPTLPRFFFFFIVHLSGFLFRSCFYLFFSYCFICIFFVVFSVCPKLHFFFCMGLLPFCFVLFLFICRVFSLGLSHTPFFFVFFLSVSFYFYLFIYVFIFCMPLSYIILCCCILYVFKLHRSVFFFCLVCWFVVFVMKIRKRPVFFFNLLFLYEELLRKGKAK